VIQALTQAAGNKKKSNVAVKFVQLSNAVQLDGKIKDKITGTLFALKRTWKESTLCNHKILNF